MRRLILALLVAATALPAFAQTTQPVYTRPSKGAPIAVFPTFTPPTSAITTYTSAVYDMTAFAELQITATSTTAAGSSPTSTTKSWGVTGFGRYVRIVAVVANQLGTARRVLVVTETAESVAGPFRQIGAPGDYEPVFNDPSNNWTIRTFALSATPLPFSTIQYTRPAKGEPLRVMRAVIDGPVAINTSGPINFENFAGLTIDVRSPGSASDCRYTPLIFIYGGDSGSGVFNLLPTQNSAYAATEPLSYYVAVPTTYISIGFGVSDRGPVGYVNCTDFWSVSITQQPSDLTSQFGASNRFFNDVEALPMGASYTFRPLNYLKRVRMQNMATAPLQCRPLGATYGVWNLAPASVLEGGDGGVAEYSDFAAPLVCNNPSVTTAGLISILNY